MFSTLCHRRSSVTFDVGAVGIRAHQLRGRGPRIALCDGLQIDIAHDDKRESAASLGPDMARLARVVDQGCFHGRDIAIMVSPPDVQLRMLRLPEHVLVQDEERIQQAVRWEMSHDTRLDPSGLEVTYWQLPPGHNQGLNVMAVCMPRAQVLDWFEQCTRHRLHLRRIDVGPRALVRVAQEMWSPADSELWGILDLGFAGARFTAVIGDVPTYVRCLTISVDDWTRRVAAGLDVPYAVADRLKRDYGIFPCSRGVRDLAGGWQSLRPEDLPHVLFGLMRGGLDELVREILKCFSYVLDSFPNLSASRVFLAGGGAGLKGLPELIETQLGLPVAVLAARGEGDAFLGQARLTDLQFGSEAATSVGGALLDLEAA